MSTPETPSSGGEQPADTEPAQTEPAQTEPIATQPAAPAPPAPAAPEPAPAVATAPPGSEAMGWPPAAAAAPSGPGRSRTERFQGWLGGLAPLAVGAFALLLLLVGFGAGALVVHAGQGDSKQMPFGRHGGFGPGQRGPGGQQAQPGQPGQRNQQSQPGQRNGTGQQQNQQGPGAFAGGFGAATAGTIVSVDGDTMTVRTAAGSTVKVTLSSSTAIRITNSGAPSDLKAGARVLVLGPNTNGTVAARSVTSGSAIATPGGSAPSS